jgi:hypothetical protein
MYPVLCFDLVSFACALDVMDNTDSRQGARPFECCLLILLSLRPPHCSARAYVRGKDIAQRSII